MNKVGLAPKFGSETALVTNGFSKPLNSRKLIGNL